VFLDRLHGNGGNLELPNVPKIAVPSILSSIYCTQSRTELSFSYNAAPKACAQLFIPIVPVLSYCCSLKVVFCRCSIHLKIILEFYCIKLSILSRSWN